MGKIINRFTEPHEDNPPTYRYNSDTDELEYLVVAKGYVDCEDRLSSHGVWLLDVPTSIGLGRNGWEIFNLKRNKRVK